LPRTEWEELIAKLHIQSQQLSNRAGIFAGEQ
jgi:hypothetical protein